MASGETADHDASLRIHPDGWGAVWRDASSPTGLSVLRDSRPASETASASGLEQLDTDFLAIHVRHATDRNNLGVPFTHPLQRSVDGWCFMHNGNQPTVHRMLGLPRSSFDSAEYFDYIIPPGAETLDEAETLARLAAIPLPGVTGGNAIAAHRDRAWLIHWRSPTDPWPRYFTMCEYVEPGLRIVASEVIPSLAPAHRWRPLPANAVMEITC